MTERGSCQSGIFRARTHAAVPTTAVILYIADVSTVQLVKRSLEKLANCCSECRDNHGRIIKGSAVTNGRREEKLRTKGISQNETPRRRGTSHREQIST